MEAALSTDPPRLRFAPSPTGYLHVGGARTALFNWLFARHFGGTLVLRIEDTDFERSTPEMVDGILEGLGWLGIDWDEGPYFQSQRMELYQAAAQRLVEAGAAYYCFCTREQLEQRRAQAQAEGGDPQYDGKCRTLTATEATARRVAGESCAIRFAVPESGSTSFDDAVFGRVEFANSEIEDFVLLRSDGVPTYHLSVVVDDLEMRMTHIVRGADHLSNTPKQVMLYNAIGVPPPVFAHVPLILGPDKTRLSKRHGATSVIAYKDEGIVPGAFRNFLALLGWTPPDSSREIMTDRELIDLFDLSGIQKSNAVFDRSKLDWFNTEYIRAYPTVLLLPLIEEEWTEGRAHPVPDQPRSHGSYSRSGEASGTQPEGFCDVVSRLLQRRVRSRSGGGAEIPKRRFSPANAGGVGFALRAGSRVLRGKLRKGAPRFRRREEREGRRLD